MSSLLLILLSSNLALAWPGESAWQPLTIGGAPLSDVEEDVVRSRTDLVGDATDPVGFWAIDDEALFFRMRINGDPCLTGYSKGGCKLLDAEGWGVVLSTDGNTDNFEAIVALYENGGVLALHPNTDGASGWDDDFDATADWSVGYPVVSEEARVLEAGSTFTADADYFIDLRVPLVELESTLGSDFGGSVQVALVTERDFSILTGSSLSEDLAGADNSKTPTLDAVISDALPLDEDQDGLLLGVEEVLGTDPSDADTDDDGLLDGEEYTDLNTDPLLCDTDTDGLPDGLELGLTNGDADTDKKACFVADADPATTTLPDVADSDGGGVSDGEEDRNQDGLQDTWETDPNDPSDDMDADKDGIPDALEESCGGSGDDADSDGIEDVTEGWNDTDGDGDPDFCDDDDDGDGIPTAEEGAEDTDGDGDPDYLDLDSDNDGTDDEIEGTGDVDCDDIRNFQDPNDEDGPCSESSGTDTGEPGGTDTAEDNGPYGFTGGSFTGGACSSLPAGAALFPAFAALLGLSRRQRRSSKRCGLGIVALLFPGTAAAQEVNAQLYQPAMDSWRFAAVQDTVIGLEGVGGGMSMNWAEAPFVYRFEDDQTEEIDLLGRVMTTDVMAYGNLRSLRIGMNVPLHALTDGFALDEAGGHLLGDISLDVRMELMDRMKGPLGLTAGLRADIPTGNGTAFLGDATSALEGRIGVATGERIVLAGGMGFRVAASDVDHIFDDVTVGSRLSFELGASAMVAKPLWVSAELMGNHYLQSGGAAGSTPIEGLFSVHGTPFSDRRLITSVGGGAGLTPGVGAPDYRVVASVGWHPVRDPRRPTPRVQQTTDADGTFDYVMHITDADGVPIAAWLRVPDRSLNIQAGPDGMLRGTLPAGTHEVFIHAQGYARTTRVLRGAENERVSMEVVLIQPRVSIGRDRLEVTERIFFELDSDVIVADSHSLLDEVAQVLKDHPEIRFLEIQGHTDDQGTEEYNQQLSQQRAEAVRMYLLSKGIAPRRLRAVGYGESMPLEEGTTEAARSVNRRVEFVIRPR